MGVQKEIARLQQRMEELMKWKRDYEFRQGSQRGLRCFHRNQTGSSSSQVEAAPSTSSIRKLKHPYHAEMTHGTMKSMEDTAKTTEVAMTEATKAVVARASEDDLTKVTEKPSAGVTEEVMEAGVTRATEAMVAKASKVDLARVTEEAVAKTTEKAVKAIEPAVTRAREKVLVRAVKESDARAVETRATRLKETVFVKGTRVAMAREVEVGVDAAKLFMELPEEEPPIKRLRGRPPYHPKVKKKRRVTKRPQDCPPKSSALICKSSKFLKRPCGRPRKTILPSKDSKPLYEPLTSQSEN